MAYGLDFDEIYYMGHNRVDIGVLNTYEIDVDLAGEKDFQIVSPEPVIPVEGYWYIPYTEYGGIVDAFETDSDDEKITYTGRTWRGMLASKIVEIPDNVQNITYPTNLTNATGTLTQALNQSLQACGMTDLFIADEEFIGEEVDARIEPFVISRGTTLYDALMGMARSVGFTLVFVFNTDHKVHIVPVLQRDYTDYLQGSRYGGTGFKTSIDFALVNHAIYCIVEKDENTNREKRRTIHFFGDENGGMKPYATVANPIKDSQYILDKRNIVFTGLDEKVVYEEIEGATEENYELVTKIPSDWRTAFGNYYQHVFETDETTGEVTESWEAYEAEQIETYGRITKKPKDWDTKYMEYYIRTYNQQEARYDYNSVSADSVLDTANKIKLNKQPSDWKSNYNEYYYEFQTGTGVEYRNYEGVSKNKYVKQTAQPSDWKTNYSDYYRKVIETKVVYIKDKDADSWNAAMGKLKPNSKAYKKKMKQGPKKSTYYVLTDVADDKNAKYVKVSQTDDYPWEAIANDKIKIKEKEFPSWSKRPHYTQVQYQIPPVFNKFNTYRINTKEVAPVFNTSEHDYYKLTTTFKAPAYVQGQVYRIVLDHYAVAVDDAIAFFEEQKRKSEITMSLEDFDVNIGDVVGGKDEFTNTKIVGEITNINVKIENGLIDADYIVTVDTVNTDLKLVESEE